MSKYLKEESYYNDLYDLFTAQECFCTVESWRSAFKDRSNAKELKDLSAKEKARHFSAALNMDLFRIKGERYKNKSSDFY